MSDVRIVLRERHLRDLLAYEPFPAGSGLDDGIRAALGAAEIVLVEGVTPVDGARAVTRRDRAITLTAAQAQALAVWLAEVVGRPDAPVSVQIALIALRMAAQRAR